MSRSPSPWSPDRFLANAYAFDVETWLIRRGVLAPRLVCASIAAGPVGSGGELLDRQQAASAFESLLEPGRIIVGANIAFDMLVMAVEAEARGVDLMPAIFRKYRDAEIFDVLIAEELHAIAGGHLGDLGYDPAIDKYVQGQYSLDAVTRLVLGRSNAKVNDEWRSRYADLSFLPISEWPYTARQYPVDDAVNTWEVAWAQVGGAPRRWSPSGHTEQNPSANLHDLPAQCRAAWALHLGAAWGLDADQEMVDALEERVTEAYQAELPRWLELGLFRTKRNGEIAQDTATTARLTAAAYGAHRPCPDCGGRCPECLGALRVPGARAGKTRLCGTCKGDGHPRCGTNPDTGRPTAGRCKKTGLDLASAQVPLTETGLVSSGRDALFESGSEDLIDFAAWSESKKILTTYTPYLRSRKNLRPRVLVETGRTSYGDVIGQLPRTGGVRECFRARPGSLLCSCDYGQLELYTHAQSCLWLLKQSALADALNNGVEVHVKLAAAMAGIPYEEGLRLHGIKDPWFKGFRQAAKPGNYGFPGGMGAVKLVLQQRKQGPDTITADGRKYKGLRFCVLVRNAPRCGEVKITEWKGRDYPPVCLACVEVAEELRDQWFRAFPENRVYFDFISEVVDLCGYVDQWVSKRRRGGVVFTSAANGYFQALAADGAKRALYRVAEEEYAVPDSPLYGSRTIIFAHDEIVAEMPEELAPAAAVRLSEIMVEEMSQVVPDVCKTLKAEPALMRQWWKDAEPKYSESGRLIVWEPAAVAA